MAITSLSGVLPLPGLSGWVGGRVGLTLTMFALHTAAALVILAAVRRARVDTSRVQPPGKYRFAPPTNMVGVHST